MNMLSFKYIIFILIYIIIQYIYIPIMINYIPWLLLEFPGLIDVPWFPQWSFGLFQSVQPAARYIATDPEDWRNWRTDDRCWEIILRVLRQIRLRSRIGSGLGSILMMTYINSYISVIYHLTLVITKLHWWRVSHLSLPPGRSWCGLFFDCDECMRPAVQMESCWDGKPVEWTCREGFLFSA